MGDFQAALRLVGPVDPAYGRERRQVLAEALHGLGRIDDLVRLLTPPQTADEAVRLMSALLGSDRLDEAESALESSTGLLDAGLIRELGDKIKARRLMQ